MDEVQYMCIHDFSIGAGYNLDIYLFMSFACWGRQSMYLFIHELNFLNQGCWHG